MVKPMNRIIESCFFPFGQTISSSLAATSYFVCCNIYRHCNSSSGTVSLPVVGIALPVVGIALSVVGIALPVVGIALSVVGIALPVVGIALSVVGINKQTIMIY